MTTDIERHNHVSNGDSSAASIGSLQIQTVLFRHSIDEVHRLVQGVAGAVRIALRHGQVNAVRLIIGDCSPNPVLTLSRAAEFREYLGLAGIEDVRYDYYGENLGSAKGHNRLLSQFEHDAVLFLNPDAYPSPFLLTEMALPLADSRVGIVEARQIPLEHPKEYDSQSGDTGWASTAGCLARRALVDDIQRFDADSFFLYCDDVDFSWRARLAGYRVVMQPAARIFHDKRLTLDGKMAVGSAEHYYAAEAALMLAWKYSRPDLADTWLAWLLQSPMELQVRAAERFRERREAGELPDPIDRDGRVAQFIGSNFAPHRFSYDD